MNARTIIRSEIRRNIAIIKDSRFRLKHGIYTDAAMHKRHIDKSYYLLSCILHARNAS